MNWKVRVALSLTVLYSTAGTSAADSAPFDRIAAAYAPYLDASDPLGWPAKAWSLSANEYKFWRGSKDLFFLWCNEHCADWRADLDAYVPAHGDLHQGNIGTYASDAGFGSVAFGMVDFDDATRLPFQVELLEGCITLRLMADESGVKPDTPTLARLDATLLDAYRAALHSDRTTTELLASDSSITGMLAASRDIPYSAELEKFCDGSFFRAKITNAKGELTDVLRPVDASAYDAFATAIAEACANDDAMARRMRATTAEYLRPRIRAVAERARLGSSGSQGLKKYLVLLARPLAGIDSDAILYLKQEIPPAAQRAGYVPSDAHTPGERAKRLMDELTSPHAFLNSHASLAGRTYWVSLKEPWSSDLSDRVKDQDELFEAARIWGTVAGAALRDANDKARVLARLDDALFVLLSERAAAYVARQHDDFTAFALDPRTLALKQQATDALAAIRK